MASLLSAAGIFLTLVPGITACVNTTDVLLPTPEGPYASSITASVLTDTSRANPFNDTDPLASPYRQLVISYYEPYLKSDCGSIGNIPYMLPAVADFFNSADLPPAFNLTTFSQAKLTGVCTEPPADNSSAQALPLLIWSGGYYTSRLQYGAFAQAISSWGYRIVTIDHPYDAAIVEFPDTGRVLPSAYDGSAPPDERSIWLQTVREADIAYVMSVVSPDPEEKLAFYGHSLGASAQTGVLGTDTTGKLVGALNLDGKMWNMTGPNGLGGPETDGQRAYMFITHDGHNITAEPSWVAWWNTTDIWTPNDPRLSVELLGTVHNAFTDFPTVIDSAGIRSLNETFFLPLFDTIYGPRELHDITSYAHEFFDWQLKGNDTHPLLDGPSDEFPDVVYQLRFGF